MKRTLAIAPRFWPALALLSLLPGCAGPASVPEAAGIDVRWINSPVVTVWPVWWERDADGLHLCGDVHRRYPGTDEDTTCSHLRIMFFDAAGRRLAERSAEFAPRQIPRGHGAQGFSRFRVLLPPPPAATARVEIQVHDEPR